jgi:hypothetical protein
MKIEISEAEADVLWGIIKKYEEARSHWSNRSLRDDGPGIITSGGSFIPHALLEKHPGIEESVAAEERRLRGARKVEKPESERSKRIRLHMEKWREENMQGWEEAVVEYQQMRKEP